MSDLRIITKRLLRLDSWCSGNLCCLHMQNALFFAAGHICKSATSFIGNEPCLFSRRPSRFKVIKNQYTAKINMHGWPNQSGFWLSSKRLKSCVKRLSCIRPRIFKVQIYVFFCGQPRLSGLQSARASSIVAISNPLKAFKVNVHFRLRNVQADSRPHSSHL